MANVGSMSEVRIAENADGTFVVETGGPGDSTRHVVTVPPGFASELGLVGVSSAALVRGSFEFLLEREPSTSILRRFGLDQITGYFPEYPVEIVRRLGGDGRS